jgi:kynurenine formamidase
MSVGDKIYSLVASARVYDLGQPYWRGMPVHPADPPFGFYLYRYHEHTRDLFRELAPGFADSISLLVTSMHAGTHLDTPIHMSRHLKVMGVDITRFESDSGYTGLPEGIPSVDRVPPLVLRGVLLDVPASKKLDILPERYEISPGDLEAACAVEGVELREGDCALIRTGYSRFFTTDADAYLHRFAGLGSEAAKWLANRRVRLVGIDNLAAGVPKPFEVHNILLSDNGILLMKSLNLEELSRDAKYVTTVIVSPLKIRGGEASLVRPLAIG